MAGEISIDDIEAIFAALSDKDDDDDDEDEKTTILAAIFAALYDEDDDDDDDEDEKTISDHYFCGICMETMAETEFFDTKFCTHKYCNDCISSYATSKVSEGLGWINCPAIPSCEAGFLNLLEFKSLLPPQVLDRWADLVCEATIKSKIYCPHKDCSAPLSLEEFEAVTECECPHCHRLFCAQCQSSWHEGMSCEEVQELDEGDRDGEDLKLMTVARSSHWQKCPDCGMFVERNEGCNHITCRCKHEFCYICGADWTSSHYSCTGPE